MGRGERCGERGKDVGGRARCGERERRGGGQKDAILHDIRGENLNR